MNPWARLNRFGRALTIGTVLVVLAAIITQSNALFVVVVILVVFWTFIVLGFGSERGPKGGPGSGGVI